MRRIKILCLVALSVLVSNNLFAYDLKIKVTALGGSLGYSYVYVNGDIKAAADSTGVAFIPLSWLKIGDVVSASFVGFNGAETVFDSKLQKTKEVTLNLTTDFSLDEIVVKADVSTLYENYTKKWEVSRGWRTQYNIKFDASTWVDSVSSKSSGEVSLLYDFRRKKMSEPARLFYNCLAFEAKGDTTNVINNIAYSHYLNIRSFTWLDYAFRNSYRGGEGETIKYGYMGILNNFRAFSISQSNDSGSGQYILYFDKDSGDIMRITYIALKYGENKEVVREFKSEFELGIFHKALTITSFNDTIKYFDDNKKSTIKSLIMSTEQIKKANYRGFERKFVEMKGMILE